MDFERFVGVRGAAWIGGVALVVSALLFAKWSIDHGFFTPTMRVALLLGGGAVALAWADVKRRQGYHSATSATSAAGIVSLYVGFYAGHELYHLFGTPVAFAGMGVVTLIAAIAALRFESVYAALLGLLGGLATPIVITAESHRPEGLFAFLIALSSGYLFISRNRRWESLAPLAVVGPAALQTVWFGDALNAGNLTAALVCFVALAVVFFHHALSVDDQQRASRASGWVGIVWALGLAPVLAGLFPAEWMQVFAYLSAIITMLVAAAAMRNATFLVAVAAVGAWLVSTMWAAGPSLISTGVVIAALGVYLFFVVLPFVSTGLSGSWRRAPIPWLTSALIGPLMFLVFRHWWALQLGREWIGAVPAGQALITAAALAAVHYTFPEGQADSEPMRSRYLALYAAVTMAFVAFAVAMQIDRRWVSVAWALYATSLLGIGIWRQLRALRVFSLAFLMVIVLKVFLYDLAALDGIYRVLSFLALGASLILVSMLYQRFVMHAEQEVTAV